MKSGWRQRISVLLIMVLVWGQEYSALAAGAFGGNSLWAAKEYVSETVKRTQEEMEKTRETEETEETKEPRLALHAKGAVLMDGYTGRVLYGKNASLALPMASTTKIMTCIVALEYGDPEALVEISSYAASMPDVQLGIQAGETYQLGDLLLSLMLESHNDSAAAIAEFIAEQVLAESRKKVLAESREEVLAESREEEPAGSRTVEKSKELVSFFARLMNRKAQEIGCSQTHFITPNGLDASERQKDKNGREREYVHSTTPAELALIMRYCLSGSKKSSEFVTVTRTKEAVFTDASGKRSFSCRNHNRYLDMKEGAIAGKTGFTGKAGYCYVGAVNQNGIYLIAVLLACGWPPSKNLKWRDMDTLIDYGLENYTCTRIEQVRKQKFCYRASAVFSSEKNREKVAAKEAKAGWVLAEIAFEPFELLLKKDEMITEYWYLDAKGGKKGEKTGEYRILAGNRLCRAFPVRIVKADSL